MESKPESVWSASCNMAERNALSGDIKADVLVIGAGMAGMLTAYLLKERGVDVVVLDASTIGGGATKNTTAKITSQHRLIYHRLIQEFGQEKAAQFAQANQAAVEKYRSMVSEKNIACDFQDLPAYVYSLDERANLEEEAKDAIAVGLPADVVDETALPFPVAGALRFTRQAQFNPLRFLQFISRDITVYEHSMVKSLEGNRAIGDQGSVTADHIVVATHYPFINTPGYYFMKMHQERSYVIALDNAPDLQGMYIDADDTGYSFRNYQDMVLLGGAGHRTGQNGAGGSYDKLRQAGGKYFEGSQEKYYWSNQDCATLDSIPYIGQYASSLPWVSVATGFNKWGMTGSMVSAMLLTDEIMGVENEYAEIFTPKRMPFWSSLKNLTDNTVTAVSGLLKAKLQVPDVVIAALPKGHGGVVEVEDQKMGVYKSPEGTSYIVSAKCPHMGCQLAWNPDELTWECPCHGSRFDICGNIINNPAMKGIAND